jgi:hypothetical protein
MPKLNINIWNAFLAFYANGNHYYPCYWFEGGWRLYYHEDDPTELMYCDSLTSCLMFLETMDEIANMYIDLFIASDLDLKEVRNV